MTSPPGKRDLRKQDTWHRIRAGAVDLFLRDGYDAVSLDDIARAAGVSRATFFNYFATKPAVVFDPDPQEAQRLRDLLAARPSGEPAWESVRQVLTGYLHLQGDRVDVTARLTSASPTLAESGRSMGDRVRPALRAWLAERHPQATELDVAVLVDVGVGATLTAFRLWRPSQGLAELYEMVRQSLDLAGGDHSRFRPPRSASARAAAARSRSSRVPA